MGKLDFTDKDTTVKEPPDFTVVSTFAGCGGSSTGGYVHGKTQEKVQNLIERYRDLAALLDGGELDIQLSSLEEAITRRIPHPDRKGATQVETEKVTQASMELIQLTADDARRLAQGFNGTRAGALMI